ncbi:S24 family peptidase [Methylorubrum sp. SB2]|uniref:S24 family peptidase n=1 Tax=Methylorubrum subtropicum TaxID=3138812 RepID=UPI00313A9F29
MADERDVIREAVARNKTLDLSKLSKALGKNHAYLQQYLERGVPKTLKDKDKKALAAMIGVSPNDLGLEDDGSGLPGDFVIVPEYELDLSAGGGSPFDEKRVVEEWPFPGAFLRNVLAVSPTRLIIVRVVGDSMEPTFKPNDRVMVDLDDVNVAQPGVFAVNLDDTAVIKRLEAVPLSRPRKIVLISDNTVHEKYTVEASRIKVIGRVIWFSRQI